MGFAAFRTYSWGKETLLTDTRCVAAAVDAGLRSGWPYHLPDVSFRLPIPNRI